MNFVINLYTKIVLLYYWCIACMQTEGISKFRVLALNKKTPSDQLIRMINTDISRYQLKLQKKYILIKIKLTKKEFT